MVRQGRLEEDRTVFKQTRHWPGRSRLRGHYWRAAWQNWVAAVSPVSIIRESTSINGARLDKLLSARQRRGRGSSVARIQGRHIHSEPEQANQVPPEPEWDDLQAGLLHVSCIDENIFIAGVRTDQETRARSDLPQVHHGES